MTCSCKNTPVPPNPQPNKKSFLEIVKNNQVTPPNQTHKIRLNARVGTQTYKGTGLLSYTSNPDGSLSHYIQIILDDANAPFIYPISGTGFIGFYEYQSHDNNHHIIHSYITNRINIYDRDLHYHIQAKPAFCQCTDYLPSECKNCKQEPIKYCIGCGLTNKY